MLLNLFSNQELQNCNISSLKGRHGDPCQYQCLQSACAIQGTCVISYTVRTAARSLQKQPLLWIKKYDTCLHLIWSYLLFPNRTYVFRSSAHDNSSTRLYFPLVNKLRQFSFWPLTARNLHLAHFYVVTFFTYFSFILGSIVCNLQIICMTTISVATLLSELDHWISCLTAVKSSLETQVSLLDSGLSHLHSSQPSSPAIHNIQSVHLALTYFL